MEIDATYLDTASDIFQVISGLAKECESWWVCLGSNAATRTSPFCRIINQFQNGNLDKLEYSVIGLSQRSDDLSTLKRLHKRGVLRVITSCEGLFEPNVYAFRMKTHYAALIISGVGISLIFGPGIACSVKVTCPHEHPFASGIESFLQSSLAMGRLLSPTELDHLETLIGPGEKIEEASDFLKAIELFCKKRDKYQCLCCGENNRDLLVIDQVNPPYLGGKVEIANFQTICKVCHSEKGVDSMNFRKTRTDLATCPIWLRELPLHVQFGIVTLTDFEELIRRTINFFYQCGSVKRVSLEKKGKKDFGWRVELEEGNDVHWLQQFAQKLLEHIHEIEESKGHGTHKTLTLESNGNCLTVSI